MKKRIILIAVAITLSLSVSIFAQQKGTIGIGGNAAFAISSYEGTTVKKVFQVSPFISRFVSNNIELGIGVSYAYDNSEYGRNENTSNSYSITPMARYFFNSGKTRPFIGLGIGYGSVSTEYKDKGYYGHSYTYDSEMSSYSVNLHGGFQFMIDKNIAAIPFVKYETSASEFEELGKFRVFMMGFELRMLLPNGF